MSDAEKLIVANLVMAVNACQTANLPFRTTLGTLERDEAIAMTRRTIAETSLQRSLQAASILIASP